MLEIRERSFVSNVFEDHRCLRISDADGPLACVINGRSGRSAARRLW
jgi:hypothetical protein